MNPVKLTTGFSKIHALPSNFREETMKKGKSLYKANHITPHVEEDRSASGEVTIKGFCMAQTRIRSVTYMVTIHLNDERFISKGEKSVVSFISWHDF